MDDAGTETHGLSGNNAEAGKGRIEGIHGLKLLAAESVKYYREKGRITPDQLHALQELKLESLAPGRRERVDKAQKDIVSRSESIGREIDDAKSQAEDLKEKSQQVVEYGEKACAEFQVQAARLEARTEVQIKDFDALKEIATRETWQDAEGDITAETDPFTGLHTKEALMQRLTGKIQEAQKNGNENRLRNIEVRAGDMNNFKQGNDILGHQGFDDLLQRDFAARFIAVSAYLGSKEYGGSADMEVIDTFFPPGSDERTRLDAAKGNITIDLYRMKAGADEIYLTTEYLDPGISDQDRDSMRDLSDSIVDDTFRSIVIGKHKTDKLHNIRGMYENSPNFFKLSYKEDAKGRHVMDGLEVDLWNKFGDGLREYLQSKAGGREITNNPDTFLRLSADMSSPHNLAEGVQVLMTGLDFNGNQIDPERFSQLMDRDGNLIPDAVTDVSEKVYSAVTRRVTSIGVASEEEMEELVELGTANMAAGLLLQLEMSESENESKPEGKRQLLINAWTGTGRRPDEDAYNVGSLLAAGRLIEDMSDQTKAREVYQKTAEVFIKRMREEMPKLEKALAEAGWKPDSNEPPPMEEVFSKGGIDYELLFFYARYNYAAQEARDHIFGYAIQQEGKDPDEVVIPAYIPDLPALPEGVKLDDLSELYRLTARERMEKKNRG